MKTPCFARVPARARLALAAGAVALLLAPATAGAWSLEIHDADGVTAAGAPQRDTLWLDVPGGATDHGLRVVRGGTVVAESHDPLQLPGGWASAISLSGFDLQPGDVIEIGEPPARATTASVAYTGRPSLELAGPGVSPALCAGVTELRGVLAPGQSLDYVWVFRAPGADPYGPEGTVPRTAITGSRGTGEPFGVALDAPLRAGQTVVASAHETLPGGHAVQTTRSRSVALCQAGGPAPGPAPDAIPSKPDTTPPAGVLAKPRAALLKKLTVAQLQRKGVTFGVTSDSDGRAELALVLRTSSTPKGKQKKVVKRVELGAGSAPVRAGERAQLTVKVAKRNAARLRKARRAKGAKLLAQVTLTDAAGNRKVLPSVTLPMPKR